MVEIMKNGMPTDAIKTIGSQKLGRLPARKLNLTAIGRKSNGRSKRARWMAMCLRRPMCLGAECGIGIARQHRRLEEKHADHLAIRRPAELRQNHLAEHLLDEEEQVR